MICPICEIRFKKNLTIDAREEYYYLVCPNCNGGVLMPRGRALRNLKHAYQKDYFNWQEASGLRKYLNKLQFFTPYNRWISQTYHLKPGKILDIGAGIPDFVMKMKKSGWDSYVLEIAPQQVVLLKNFLSEKKVMQGDFETHVIKRNYFEVITFWHMLEHLSNPAKSVRKVHQILKKQGMIYAEFPNFDSLNLKLFGTRYTHFDLPGHLVYYNHKSIDILFKNNGFTNIKISYPLKLNGSFSLNLAKIIFQKTNSYILSQSLFYFLLPLSVLLAVVNSYLGKTDLMRVSAVKG